MEQKDKPRLAEVLGVDVGEKFAIKGHAGDKTIFCVNEKGIMCWKGVGVDNVTAIFTAINHPESIIRIPHLTEAEIKRCRAFGAKYLTRNGGKHIVHMWDKMPGVLEGSDGTYYIIGNSGALDIGGVDSSFFPSVEPDGCICVEYLVKETFYGKE